MYTTFSKILLKTGNKEIGLSEANVNSIIDCVGPISLMDSNTNFPTCKI